MTIEFDSVETIETPPRGGRRRRLIAGVGAAMLVAAAGGVGFGIGRNVDRDAAEVLSPAAQEDTDAGESSDPVSTEAPAPQPTQERPPTATVPLGDAPADGDMAFEQEAGPAISGSGGPGWTIFGDQVNELLAERTTDSGVVVRAHLGQVYDAEMYEMGYGEEFGGEPNGWQPPGWCFESAQVRIALAGGESTGTSVIDVGSVSWWTEPYEGRSVSWVTLGRADGNPHRVIFAQVPSDSESVTVTFGDGATDTTAPQNGVALLVVPGAPDTVEHSEHGYAWFEELPDFTLDIAGGADPASLGHDDVGTWNNPEFQASCSPPPPELPEPGEQPIDTSAAEQEITELMTSIYGPDDGLFETLDFIDDPSGVQEARDQVREGGLEESAASAEAIVEELVFTTPTEAWFRYRIETINGTFGPRFGIAVIVDDVWKITKATICQDLQMAGGSCGDEYYEVHPQYGVQNYNDHEVVTTDVPAIEVSPGD